LCSGEIHASTDSKIQSPLRSFTHPNCHHNDRSQISRGSGFDTSCRKSNVLALRFQSISIDRANTSVMDERGSFLSDNDQLLCGLRARCQVTYLHFLRLLVRTPKYVYKGNSPSSRAGPGKTNNRSANVSQVQRCCSMRDFLQRQSSPPPPLPLHCFLGGWRGRKHHREYRPHQ
jgi:hypothetical protein